ncbi:MAG: hypothetical protein IKK57_10220 [Clostridia bacterium]|nr:hypothetical protein [Clostridia bacterium]
MIPHDKLFSFTPAEDAQYTLQITLQQSRLLGAPDALDLYSCHSQPHVLEVMEQCGMLLDAFLPWLQEKLPGVSPAWMRDHLLLSAKLHDVGMCGTPALRALLTATDSLHTLLCTPGQESPAMLRPYLRVLEAEGPRAALNTPAWQQALTLAGTGDEGRCAAALAEYHEQIKQAIRKQHAANSGRYILAHADELSAHYGPAIDMTAVAVLAALHSSSSLDKASIVPAGKHYDAIREHIRRMVTQERSAAEAERITADDTFRRLIHLAALLRLCDTRRSGSRLTNMDQSRLVCEVTGGQARLYKEKSGLREAVPLRTSYEILVSEALTEFGPVTAHPNADGTWHIRHEMTLRHAELPDMLDVFARSRLRTYANEIDTGALEYSLGFTHEIFLHLEGIGPMAAGRVAREWRSRIDWLRESPLLITTI